MFFNLEDFGFAVEVVDWGHLNASSGDAEGAILNNLELAEGGGADVWIPDWTGVGDSGAD